MPEEGEASLGVRVVHHLRTLVAFGSAAVVVSADEETGAQTDVVVRRADHHAKFAGLNDVASLAVD